jgi:hypothetical protein
VVDPRWPVSQGIRTSDIVKSVIGLLSMGKSDFDAIEAFRQDPFFQQSLGLNKVPSSAWLRQHLDAVAGDLRERLPSGKFDTNDAILHLASFTYNCLRLLGQLGLTGTIAPVRHPAKRRRLKTVLQEIMYRAAKVVAHARQWVLDFGRGVVAHAQVFVHLQQRLAAASP